MMRALRLLLLASLLIGTSLNALAGEPAFPSKPVRIIVPYPPGGLGDIFPRALATWLAERIAQPVIVDNRPGGSQIIGAVMAAKSAADGYTLFFGSVTSLAINVSAQKNLPYDPLKDFAPVTFCFSTPLYLVVNPGVAATTVKELIALAKSRARPLTCAVSARHSYVLCIGRHRHARDPTARHRHRQHHVAGDGDDGGGVAACVLFVEEAQRSTRAVGGDQRNETALCPTHANCHGGVDGEDGGGGGR